MKEWSACYNILSLSVVSRYKFCESKEIIYNRTFLSDRQQLSLLWYAPCHHGMARP